MSAPAAAGLAARPSRQSDSTTAAAARTTLRVGGADRERQARGRVGQRGAPMRASFGTSLYWAGRYSPGAPDRTPGQSEDILSTGSLGEWALRRRTLHELRTPIGQASDLIDELGAVRAKARVVCDD